MRAEAVRQGADVSQLDQAMSQLRSLTDPKSVDDPRTIADLKNRTVQEMEEFEFGLKRALTGDQKDGIHVGASGDVPQGYQSLVEQYWMSIGRNPNDSTAGSTAAKKPPAKPPL